MKPYNHVSYLHPMLQRFATYLGSQGIKFKILAPDYDSPAGRIIVNKRYFAPKGSNLISYLPFEYNDHKTFSCFPTLEELS